MISRYLLSATAALFALANAGSASAASTFYATSNNSWGWNSSNGYLGTVNAPAGGNTVLSVVVTKAGTYNVTADAGYSLINGANDTVGYTTPQGECYISGGWTKAGGTLGAGVGVADWTSYVSAGFQILTYGTLHINGVVVLPINTTVSMHCFNGSAGGQYTPYTGFSVSSPTMILTPITLAAGETP